MEFLQNFESIPRPIRIKRAQEIKYKYYPRLPLLIDRFQKKDPLLKSNKFLVSPTIQFSEFMILLRKQLKMEPYQALFLCSKSGNPINMSETVGQVYHHIGNPDGFLYIVYSLENTFG